MQIDLPRKPLNLAQFFGLWSIEDQQGRQLEQYMEMFGAEHIASGTVQQISSEFSQTVPTRFGDIAVINVEGPLTKHGSSFSEDGSYTALRRKFSAAKASSSVAGVLLKIDSPGGAAAGVNDVAVDLRNLRSIKPVVVFGEDLVASAAYEIASQANHIVMNPSGFAGSIGTYAAVVDSSARAEAMGLKVHVIRSGEFKGAGISGAPVTEEHIAEFQRMIDSMNDDFLQAIERGRGMSSAAVSKLADGRIHKAAEAVTLGLVDSVGTFQDALNVLEKLIMTDTSRPATANELKKALPNISADQVVDYLQQELSIEDAKDAFILSTSELIESQKKQIADAEAKANANAEAIELVKQELEDDKKNRSSGNAPQPVDDGYDGGIIHMSAREEMKHEVNRIAKEERVSRERAFGRVHTRNPELIKRVQAEQDQLKAQAQSKAG